MATQSLLGIDHGTKRTGFAVADPLRITCAPLETYAGPPAGLLDHVAELLAERDVEAFVVGLPLNMDGTEGPRCAEVRAFAATLAARFPDVRVTFQDERLTTKAAEELLRETGRGRRGPDRDGLAAVVLLRDWIDGGEDRGTSAGS